MQFNSVEFLGFAAAVCVLAWRLQGAWRIRLLLGASYVYYATFDWRFLGLLLLVTAGDLLLGPRLAEGSTTQRRMALAAALLLNLGVLATFKYLGFFVDGVMELMRSLGLEPSASTIDIVVPIGLSFYVFQSVGYCIDVHRGSIAPERDPVVLGAFLAFFPQLAAGPISRAALLMPQLRSPPVRPRPGDLRVGVDLILLGLVRKVVIADMLAPSVSRVFAGTSLDGGTSASADHGWVVLVAATLGFAAQLYGDFAGYSCIARGTAKLLGIDVPSNFARPFAATSLADFWRRWHITLMTFLRDYLYMPLLRGMPRAPGLRRREHRAAAAIVCSFTAAGLWHGASVRWLLWGAITGAIVAVDQLRSNKAAMRGDATSSPVAALSRRVAPARTTLLFAVLAVLAGAADVQALTHIWSGMATLRSGAVDVPFVLLVWAAWMVVLATDRWEIRIERGERWWQERGGAVALVGDRSREPIGDVAWGIIAGSSVVAILVLAPSNPQPFFYVGF